MLRITENLDGKRTVRLRLDGTLSAESFRELAQICARHQRAGSKTLIVDMAGVDFMHDDAARMLAQLHGESVRLMNCSPFIAVLLEATKSID